MAFGDTCHGGSAQLKIPRPDGRLQEAKMYMSYDNRIIKIRSFVPSVRSHSSSMSRGQRDRIVPIGACVFHQRWN